MQLETFTSLENLPVKDFRKPTIELLTPIFKNPLTGKNVECLQILNFDKSDK
jgi:hypothetical protein